MAAALGLTACTTKNQAPVSQSKTLVLYYSQNGSTKTVAEEIQKMTGADIDSIVAVNPYNGTFEETIARCQKEMADSTVAELKALSVDVAAYDTIYLGYPVWFGTIARPMASFVATADLSGKKVIPFCTFGSGGLNTSVADLQKAQPNAEILNGYGVRTARIASVPAEVEYFLKSNKYIEGLVEPMPKYSEQHPVTDEEKGIFTAACSSYQFPLGTPVTCGSRVTRKSTDYLYTAQNIGQNGDTVNVTIKVTIPNKEGATPEFTEVIR